MRTRAAAVAVLVGLCLAGAAQAKGPDTARTCGASGCSTVHDAVRVYRLVQWTYAPFTLSTAPKPAPFYRISLSDRGRPYMIFVYVPSQRLVRVWMPADHHTYAPGAGDPYWRPVNAQGAAALGQAIAGLTPFRAPRAWR